MPPASVVIVAYEAGEALLRCLRSLADEGQNEVVVVNNGGRGSEIVEAERMPGVEVVTPGENVGFARGCNLGAELATGDVLVFLNPDTVVAPGAVRRLAETLADGSVGVAMPRLRLLDEPALLNSRGNVVHLTGIAWAGGYREPADRATDVRDVPYASGAALAIRAEVFRELGGFTDELFMYQEDLELGWKARMRGLRVVLDARADVFHDYSFEGYGAKRYLLERNRLVFVLSAFSGRLLCVLAPLLLAVEHGMTALAAREGRLRDKVRGWAWCVRNARWLVRHRRETQRLRRVSDRELAAALTPVVDPGMLAVPRVVRAANPLMAAYWAVARRLL